MANKSASKKNKAHATNEKTQAASYGSALSENDLISTISHALRTIVYAQVAPIGLLLGTVVTVPTIRQAGGAAVWAMLGILLAAGILGALIEFIAADLAQAACRDLASRHRHAPLTRAGQRLGQLAPWFDVVRWLTPAIFVLIFVALLFALLA